MNALKKLKRECIKYKSRISKKKYNQVYETLVEDEDDLVGQIAYCMYKQNKQKYIRSFEEEHKRLPSDEELEVYVKCSEIPKLSLYEAQAEELISNTLSQAVSEKELELNRQFEQKLKKFVYDYEPAGFWERNFFNHTSGAFSGLLGNLLTTVVLIGFLYSIAPSDARDEFIVSASKNLIAALATFLNVDIQI
ncbi:MICOS complex subunit MIC60 [Vibrio alginolyticus]|uniref:MICOS complex subunit MIC60 n=1 Tax=Vibrio sp. MA64 TaxID=2896365 RepID=UPI001E4C62F3|nr:MICOS complex subunit MIC60 [Vibrio sp. MA64]EGQ9765640.1 hypothetical protein [Vibrio alginolyticus]MCC9653936.1 MICOS complex subunit MIC60 [Vibrio sp. MA64]